MQDIERSAPWPAPAPPLATILFAKHAGRTCPQAVALARQARVYREQVKGRAAHHVATFERTAAQASAAAALLRLTMDLKSAIVLDGDGLMVPSIHAAMQVLDCYRQASLCDDSTAYCQVVINDPFRQRGRFGLHDLADRQADRWVLPCHRINPSYLRFDAHHPASASALIQAAAVRHGSSWCPHFRARDFRPVVVVADGEADSRIEEIGDA